RRAVVRGAVVHTPSRYVAEEVIDYFGARPEQVVAVHHGIPTGIGAGGDASAGAEPGPLAPQRLPKGAARYVLAVGTVEPRKDYPGLVRAFDAVAADHDDVALVIAGGQGWGSAELTDALTRASHRERVVCTGYVDDAELKAWMGGAAVLVYPSRYEGFGFPPLQAMAAGVPVVTTDAGAVPEIVGDAAVVVPVGDTDALAAGLDAVLDDEMRRQTLIAAGRERAGEFTWETCASGLAALYVSAASAVDA
ncbi:MAG: glycosyltransferase family 4 protein, partial [Acidimicrobiales bacterium]